MTTFQRRTLSILVLTSCLGFTLAPSRGEGADDSPPVVRFATYNVSLHRSAAGELMRDLATGTDAQAHQIAEIIQIVRPDVLLLNEFDYDEEGQALRLFQEHYLAVPQNGNEPLVYPYHFAGPVNTGVPTGLDLDHDGRSDGPNDAFGFGRYPGQYGMVLLSMFPIEHEGLRTFQHFLWKDLPGAQLPTFPETGTPYYSDEALEVFRLSSKSHWIVPLDVHGRQIHVLAAHPTPPAFDGPERRNVLRNHDELRLLADLLDPETGAVLYDDQGRRGGLGPGAHFVILGDLNADPYDGNGHDGAIQRLLSHPRVDASLVPTSRGGVEASQANPGPNARHRGDPAHDTANFSHPNGPGNLRVDYVLPSITLKPVAGSVFWPAEGEPGADLVEASDHRLVSLDIE